MGMRETYAYAIQTAKGKFNGNAEERDGKLHFKGTVATEADMNAIWQAIKTIPTHEDLRAEQGPVDGSRQDQARAGPPPPVRVLPSVEGGARTLAALDAPLPTLQKLPY